MCRAFRLKGRYSEGRRLLQNYDLPIPRDDQSRCLNVQFQRELALCESYLDDCKACPMFADAVRSIIDLLGKIDNDTIQVRVNFAEFLGRSSRYSGALAVLLALNVDTKGVSHPWRVCVKQMEEGLNDKRVKKRKRERPMPAEQTLTEDDKENIHESGPHSSFKKRRLMQEICT